MSEITKAHVRCLTKASGTAIARFVFAHGAGAGMDSDFMQNMTAKLADKGVEVWRFNFPYMQQMSESGNRKPPNRMPALLAHYIAELELQQTALPLFIGGKSMGGRAATLLAADCPEPLQALIQGVIVLGYPFHPAGKPDKLRVEHLGAMQSPCLIVQGERDTMGNQQEVAGYGLGDKLNVVFMPDGDHSLKPRKASGVSLEQNLDTACATIVAFIQQRI